jgi:hypothetical protein
MSKNAVLGGFALISVLLPRVASAEGFSIDLASPSVIVDTNSAILSAGPVGGPLVVERQPISIGLAGGTTDEANSMTFGSGAPWKVFHFSVDRHSIGATGDVVTEAAAGQAAGDLFATDFDATNWLSINQHELGLAPAVLRDTPVDPPIDELDAFDFGYHSAAAELINYTLEPGHPLMGSEIGCGGEVFFVGDLWWSYTSMGLSSCLDDIDALEVDNVRLMIFYSLAPGSPSLLPGSPIIGCSAGCSPADIFVVEQLPPPIGQITRVFATAAELGLLPTDNVDAIALGDPPPLVPLLGGGGTVALALVLLATGRASTQRERTAQRFPKAHLVESRNRGLVREPPPESRAPSQLKTQQAGEQCRARHILMCVASRQR